MVGESSGEAGELAVSSGGAVSTSVTVLTSWLVSSGDGVGTGTSVNCSCSLCSGTCGKPIRCTQGFPDLECYSHPGRTSACKQGRGPGLASLWAHLHKQVAVPNPQSPLPSLSALPSQREPREAQMAMAGDGRRPAGDPWSRGLALALAWLIGE